MNIQRDTSLLSQEKYGTIKLSFTIYIHTHKAWWWFCRYKKGLVIIIMKVITCASLLICCTHYYLLHFEQKLFSISFLIMNAFGQCKETSYQFPFNMLDRMTYIYQEKAFLPFFFYLLLFLSIFLKMATPEHFFCTVSSAMYIVIKLVLFLTALK